MSKAEQLKAEIELLRRRLLAPCAQVSSEGVSRFGEEKSLLLSLERQLGLLTATEAAVPVEWGVPWDGGNPDVQVFAHALTLLIVYVVGPTKRGFSDAESANLPASSRTRVGQYAIAEFSMCYQFAFGGPNDEVHHGHPLYGKGLEANTAFEVINSRWLEDAKGIDQAHPQFYAASWEERHHYLLVFHDYMLHCLAKSYAVAVHGECKEAAISHALQRLRTTP